MIIEKDCDNKSGNINEVIKDDFGLFFTKIFYAQKKHKKHKMQASDFHSDLFVRLKSLKRKQATFTQIFLYA